MKKIIILLSMLFSISLYGQLDTVNVGVNANNRQGDPLRTAFQKINVGLKTIDTIRTDTVSLADPAIIVADSGVYNGGYTTPRGTDVKVITKARSDIQLISSLFGAPILYESAVAPASFATNAATDLVDGTVYFEAVYIRQNDTITGAKALSGAASTYNQNNFNGFGLYTWEVGDTIRQVAISANDSTLFETGDGSTITAAFVEVAGKRYYPTPGLYFVAFVWNSLKVPATVPEVYCIGGVGAQVSIAVTPSGKRMSATLASQATLPAKVKLSDLTTNTSPKWVALY